MPDHYEALCVPRSASEQEIKRAYRTLVLGLHPDKDRPDSGDNAPQVQRFMQVQRAWETLRDSESRELYDRDLEEQEILRSRVQDVVDARDMIHNPEEDLYELQCRCGGSYCITADEILDGFDVTQCNGCSFSIMVKSDLGANPSPTTAADQGQG